MKRSYFARIEHSFKKHFLTLLKKLESFEFEPGSYLIWGSGPLAIRNLREARDVDIIVNKELWTQLTKVNPICGPKKNLIKLGEIEVWSDCMNLTDKIDEMITNQDLIEGYPFMKLPYVLQWKKWLNREKDLQDITLIEDHLISCNQECTRIAEW